MSTQEADFTLANWLVSSRTIAHFTNSANRMCLFYKKAQNGFANADNIGGVRLRCHQPPNLKTPNHRNRIGGNLPLAIGSETIEKGRLGMHEALLEKAAPDWLG
jgi:hypothetical protein